MMKKSFKKDSENRDAKRFKKSKSESGSSDDESSSGSSSDSESSSSDSSSVSSSDPPESNSTDSQIKKINRYIQSLTSELEKAQHKYGKIERALVKSVGQDEKLKKIKKYKVKYKRKIDKLRKRIEHFKIKQVQLNRDKSQPVQNVEPKKSLKVPYPVLNDKRDMKIILDTLDKKFRELSIKKDLNKKNLSQTDKNSANYSKLVQLEQALEAQKEKLSKQIEYLKLSLNLEAIHKQPNQGPAMRQRAAKLTTRINDLFNFMKNENKNFLGETSEPVVKQEDLAEKKIIDLNEQLNKALVAYLAHTAATAHTAAAISAVNYNYYNYYQTQMGKLNEIPMKTEIENASNKFGKLKEKISTFLTLSKLSEKKVEQRPKLIADYSDDESETSEIVEVNKESDESEDEDDLEIVMTSELKLDPNSRNYLLPNLKASYFPLKASLIDDSEDKNQIESNELIAVEQSKFALTFLANGSNIYNYTSCFNKRPNVKLSDILYSN